MASFVDPRNISPDLKIARLGVIKKIQELEKEISFQTTLLYYLKSQSKTEDVTNEDLMNRLNILERAINEQFYDLKLGQTYIFQKIRPDYLNLLKMILNEVHQGFLEQGEMQISFSL